MSDEILYGWYSPTAANQFGSSIYLKPDGSGVEVTFVAPASMADQYNWPDKIAIGPVVEWIMTGRDTDWHYS